MFEISTYWKSWKKQIFEKKLIEIWVPSEIE